MVLVASGLTVRPGVSDHALSALEHKIGGPLPLDFKDVYRLVDGMENHEGVGELLFNLWNLGRIRDTLMAEREEGQSGQYTARRDSTQGQWLKFSDYLISSDEFEIDVATTPAVSTQVRRVGDRTVVASSLSEFLRSWLDDPSAMI